MKKIMLYLNSEYSFYNNLWILELIILLLTIFTVISKNPIICVLFLISVFIGVAIYMLILGLSFIGISYLLVYVGAVSILILFILMLIDVRTSELHNDTNNNIFLSIALTFVYFNLFFYYSNSNNNQYKIVNVNLKHMNLHDNVKHSLYNIWDGNLIENTDIVSIGSIFYNYSSIWLILSLLTLLLAMIGSIKINITSQIS